VLQCPNLHPHHCPSHHHPADSIEHCHEILKGATPIIARTLSPGTYICFFFIIILRKRMNSLGLLGSEIRAPGYTCNKTAYIIMVLFVIIAFSVIIVFVFVALLYDDKK
jgi:hypothetical protein